VKPPILYFGGKITLGPAIAALLPPHEHYVEPFAGSLAVLLAKLPSPHETVNDLDGAVMAFWRVLRDQPEALERICALTPHSRAEFAAARDLDGAPTDLEMARRVWVLLTQGRAARLTRTGWRHYCDPVRSSVGMPGYLAGYVQRLAPAAARLANVSLECRPALDLIRKYGSVPEVLLYVDPPYLGSTRANDSAYRVEMRTEAEHRELAEALHTCRATVVLSGYSSALYDSEMYPDWHRRTFDASTGQGGTWANRTEVLWSNRPLADNQPTLWDHTEEACG
jgi:DNA adenine methylase